MAQSTREALQLRGPTRRQLSRHEREQRTRRAILIGGTTLLALIVVILGIGYVRENVLRGQQTAATIFGERISVNDVVELARPRVQAIDRQLAIMRANNMEAQLGQLEFQRAQVAESVANELVEDRVIRREAANRGISVAPDEVDARIRQNIAQYDAAQQPQPTATPAATAPPGATPTATAAGTPTRVPTVTPAPTLTEDRFGPMLTEYLNVTGNKEPRFREMIESDLYEEKLRRAIGEEIPAVQEQVHARQMTFRTEDDAKAAWDQLQGGSAFDELARTLSTDRATKDRGGDLGWVPRRGLDPAFDDALFALQPGQRSGPVQTAGGWSIFEVLERDPARPVDESALDTLRRRRYGDWLAAAQASPEIERSLDVDTSDWILRRASSRRS